MNFAIVVAALVLGADGGEQCVDLQSTPEMRVQQCGRYVFTNGDVLPLTTKPTIELFFAGQLAVVSSPPVEPKPIEVTLGKAKYEGRVGTVSSGSFAGAEVLTVTIPLPNTERVRLLGCIAELRHGATRAECIKRFTMMRDEPVAPERENVAPGLGGVPLPVPNGCRVVEGSIRCNEGALILPPGELSSRSGDVVDRKVAEFITLMAKISESASAVVAVDCAVQGKPARCQMVSSTDKMKQRYFHLASAVADGSKRRAASCGSSVDPRKTMPVVCSSIFSFKGNK